MLRPSRKSRISPLRRTLTVEALEDRTLLNGVVRVLLNPNGLLQITGDAGNNAFTIAPGPESGTIRVSGNPGTFTSVNGRSFADFALVEVSDIVIDLQTGRDNVRVTNFNITGDLTIFAQGEDDVIATPNFNAAHINILLSGGGGFPGSGGGSGGGGVPGGTLGSGQNGGLVPPPSGGFGSGFGGGGLLPPLG